MWTKLLSFGCLVGVAILGSVAAEDYDDEPEPIFTIPKITPDVRYDQIVSEQVAQSVMNFAHDLGMSLDQNEYPNTQIFSPLSVMSALSILEMGSYGNSFKQLNQLFAKLKGVDQSKIHEEFGWLIEDVMQSKDNPRRPRKQPEWRQTSANRDYANNKNADNTPNDHIVRVSNALFVQNDFNLRPDYISAAESVYRSEVTPVDFKNDKTNAKHYINSWVSQNTLGKIPTIIEDELTTDTKMVLASTLYFKGFWEQPFLGSGTAKANFYPDGPDSLPYRVSMMGTGGFFPFYDATEYNCRIIGLPYKGNQTTMYIIHPYESTRLRLQELQKELTGEKINEIISKMEQKTAVLAFPKFHVTSQMQLKTPLKKLGYNDIFLNGASDLSLIAEPELVKNLQPAASAARFPSQVLQQQETMLLNTPLVVAPVPSLPHQRGHAYEGPRDRFDDVPLIFSRFGETNETKKTTNETKTTTRPGQNTKMVWSQQGDLMTGVPVSRSKRAVTYKVESEFLRGSSPLRLKDLILNKRITKPNPGKKLLRNRREALPQSAESLQALERLRSTAGLKKPPLYVDEILHKVDFNVNEQGTEAAAVTLAYLRRSGTDVAFRCDSPFLILIRHDPTKLPLFYGVVNIPA